MNKMNKVNKVNKVIESLIAYGNTLDKTDNLLRSVFYMYLKEHSDVNKFFCRDIENKIKALTGETGKGSTLTEHYSIDFDIEFCNMTLYELKKIYNLTNLDDVIKKNSILNDLPNPHKESPRL